MAEMVEDELNGSEADGRDSDDAGVFGAEIGVDSSVREFVVKGSDGTESSMP